MKHYIIVKFNDKLKDKETIYPQIVQLFNQALELEGIHNINYLYSNSTQLNRYDLMIVMSLNEDSLSIFDHSHIHHDWKSKFSHLIESKAIFDCDD